MVEKNTPSSAWESFLEGLRKRGIHGIKDRTKLVCVRQVPYSCTVLSLNLCILAIFLSMELRPASFP